MKAPRTAHWLLVPTLALGIAVAPVRAQAAVGPAPVDAEKGAKEERSEAPKGGSAAPKTGSGAAPEGGSAPPKTGSASTPEGGEAAPKGDAGGNAPSAGAPKGKASKLPKSTATAPPAAGGATGAEAGTEPVEGTPGAAPEAGTTPEAGAPAAEGEPTEGEPTEAAPTEAAPIEPEITVQPRPVEPSLETTPRSGTAASREAVADPRRLRADDRILFRAGVLSLGIAAAAVVPTVIGFQQAYVANEDDDPSRERTMRGLGIGAGIAAGTYAITGIVLLSLGARQRRAAVAPAVGPGQVGAVFRARF